jgi:hypothetical protein
MHALSRRLLADRHLRGLAPTPPPCDLHAVTPLAHPDRRAPDPSRDAELRPSCLSGITEPPVAASP